MKASFIAAAAWAALTWAAPVSKRQCFVDDLGVQSCIDNPICKTHQDGSVICVSKRGTTTTSTIEKRQCYVSKDGVQTCIDNPRCFQNDDGSFYCISKNKRDEVEIVTTKRDAVCLEWEETVLYR